jgi:hypothetical protein
MLILSFIAFVTRYISLSNSPGHATDLRLSKGNLEAMFLLNNCDIVNYLLSRAVLLRPAFARNCTTHLQIDRKFAVSKPPLNLLVVFIAV